MVGKIYGACSSDFEKSSSVFVFKFQRAEKEEIDSEAELVVCMRLRQLCGGMI